MRLWLREWLRVGPAIAVAGGLLWLLAEGDIGPGALLRSVLWAGVVWAACGLVWISLHYARWDDEPARVAGPSTRARRRRHVEPAATASDRRPVAFHGPRPRGVARWVE
jgi:hypothetical protein